MKKYSRRGKRGDNASAAAILLGLTLTIVFVIYVINSLCQFISENIWIVILVASVAILAIALQITFKIIDRKYERFVKEHSLAVKRIVELNGKYNFEFVSDMNMENSYDNENFYDDISPLDYLTYQLVYKRKEALQAIASAQKNKNLYSFYNKYVSEITEFDKYDTEEVPKNKTLRQRHEKALFNKSVLRPKTRFDIHVNIILTNINGNYRYSKSELFDEDQINSVIVGLSHRDGDFYLDENIWNSICRVERGKVTNKIRFAVYTRDGNRCRRCGSTYDLEVDHIFPISKGGKSNFDNLQTLCKTCNTLKSNKIEVGAVRPNSRRYSNNVSCPDCGAPMILKNGKYGKFYGCSNYPTCKCTKQA